MAEATMYFVNISGRDSAESASRESIDRFLVDAIANYHPGGMLHRHACHASEALIAQAEKNGRSCSGNGAFAVVVTEVVTEAQLDAMVSDAVQAMDDDINEALRKAITDQVGSDWTGDVDPPTAFQWDEALRRLVRCLMLNAFDYGDNGELVRR